MRTDALEIDRFYRTAPGQMAQDMLRRRLASLWPDVQGLDLLGLGYATPFLKLFHDQAQRTVAYMPAAQGAIAWPSKQHCLTALGDEHRLAFPESLFDRVILVHALEEAHDLRKLLREVWRVIVPEGRLVVITANRGGLWSLNDSIPFGHGRPFSRRQLYRLLQETLFEPTAFSRAVYAPPWRWASGQTIANGFETLGEKFWPGLGGLLLVEAVKHVGAVHPTGHAQRRLKPGLEPVARPGLSHAVKTPDRPSGPQTKD